jgi:CSLREA domain-containing protein
VTHLFAKLFGTTKGRRQLRPRLEGLEDRLVPATIRVTTIADVVNPKDGKVSLREAITAANRTTAPDMIILPAGVYRIAILPDVANPDPNATGSFDILAGTTLVGAGAGKTIINAGQADRVFAWRRGPGRERRLHQPGPQPHRRRQRQHGIWRHE